MLRNDVGFPTVYRRIYCRKFMTLSNQTSRCICKCIRIVVYCSSQSLLSAALCLTMECRDCSEASCPAGYRCYEARAGPGCFESPLHQHHEITSMSRAGAQGDLEIFCCIWLHLNLWVFSNLYSPFPSYRRLLTLLQTEQTQIRQLL